jgi:anti-sigma regulatory factor (Ser/Thr protein kinase)
MNNNRLILSNREENSKLLQGFIRKWAQARGLSEVRLATLESATVQIFKYLVHRAYRPDQHGSIAVALEEKGPRVRLTFEDDADPHDPTRSPASPGDDPDPPGNSSGLAELRPRADSVIYYRTNDRKNRLVVFLTL